MSERTISADDLANLKQEREDADRRYNDLLSALDGAVQQLRQMPPPPPPYDENQFTTLNERWDLIAVRPRVAGWRGRLQSLMWSLVGPLFERQHAFNSALVDHLNRNITAHRGTAASLSSVLTLLQEELARTVEFQTKLIQFVQQITPYVDTKDREVSGLMRRINEDVAVVNDGLVGTLSGVADEMRKRFESTVARERRLESRIDDVRSTTAVAHRLSQTLKRELERFATVTPMTPTPDASSAVPTPASVVRAGSLDSYKYVGFEDQFRGSTDDIRARLESYLPCFEGATDVLDAGCGRGEFLELLRDRGVGACGIDLNHDMVEECRARGLTVDEGDLLSYLRRQPDASLGGIFASQVVEHLQPDYLLGVLDAAFGTLRPGSKIVLETINVASWSAFFQSFVRDITHTQPLHPETLQYLVTASGFQNVELSFKSPCALQNKLEEVPAPSSEAARAIPALKTLVVAFNENVEKLNGLMFADQDYAVIGERP